MSNFIFSPVDSTQSYMCIQIQVFIKFRKNYQIYSNLLFCHERINQFHGVDYPIPFVVTSHIFQASLRSRFLRISFDGVSCINVMVKYKSYQDRKVIFCGV